MSCEAIFSVKINGEVENIKLPLNLDSYNDVNTAIKEKGDIYDIIVDTLQNNSKIKSELLSSLDKTKIKPNKYTINSFSDSNLPLGNTNLHQMSNLYSDDNISTYISGLSKLDVDLDGENILLLDCPFSINYFEHAGIYSRDNYQVSIIKDNPDSVKAYLNYLYVSKWLEKNPDSWQAKNIESKINSILEEIKQHVNDSKRLNKIYETIIKSPSKIDTFLRYFKLSTGFISEMYANNIKYFDLRTLTNDLIDPDNMSDKVYYDSKEVREFIENIKKGDIVQKSDFEDFMKKYNFSSIQDVITYLNGKDANLELVFDGETAVLLKDLNKNNPDKESMISFNNIDSEYYGDMLTLLYEEKGYSIYSDGNLYYISDLYCRTKEDIILNEAYENMDKAKSALKSILDKEVLLFDSDIRSKRLIGKSLEKYKGSLFKALDIESFNDEKILSNIPDFEKNGFILSKTMLDFSKHAMNNAFRRYDTVLKNRIKSVLNTKEKVLTFLLLKSKIALDKNYNRTRFNNEIESELTNLALNEIENAQIVTYKVDENGKAEKLEQLENKFDRNKSFDKSDPKGDLIEVCDSLSKRFGIKINLIDNESIKDFPEIKHTAKAFIYKGEVYINIDQANKLDVLHEYGHLIMGTVKYRNPKLYELLTNKISESSDFQEQFNKLREIYPNRAESDLLEELFVDYFAKSNIDLNYSEIKELKGEIKKIFGLKSDMTEALYGEISNMTLNELMLNFGSVVLGEPEHIVEFDLATNSRVVSNLIEKLIAKNLLKENCNG